MDIVRLVSNTLAWGVATVAAGCASVQPGGAMPGVNVIGKGGDVALTWTQDSPIASRLGTRTRLELLADFPGHDGPVTGLSLASTLGVAGQPAVFRLPETVRPVPAGPICLYLRRAGDSYPLPVRTAGGSDGTAGFRYAAWEAQVTERSRQSVLEGERDKLTQHAAQTRQALERLDRQRDASGYTSAAACEKVAAAGHMEKPRSVVSPDAQASAARNICSKRLSVMAQYTHQGRVRDLLSHVAAALPGLPAARLTQYERMSQDWREAESVIASGYVPELGDEDDYLPVAGVALDIVREGGKRRVLVDPAGLLDAYAICREDVRKQLVDEWEGWQAAQNAGPQRRERAAEFARNECRKHFSARSELDAQAQRLANRARELDTQLQAVKTANRSLPQSEDLLVQACRRR